MGIPIFDHLPAARLFFANGYYVYRQKCICSLYFLRESCEAMITTIHKKIDLLLVPASFMPASGRSPKQSPFWGELPFHLGPRLPFAPRCCPLSLAC